MAGAKQQRKDAGAVRRDEMGLEILESRAAIPQFMSESEEQQFWSTHSLSDDMLEEMQPVPGRGEDGLPPPEAFQSRREQRAATAGRTRPIAIRVDPDMLRRLRHLAGLKGKGYQTLLKEFVIERIYEEEKRLGVVG